MKINFLLLLVIFYLIFVIIGIKKKLGLDKLNELGRELGIIKDTPRDSLVESFELFQIGIGSKKPN